MYGIIQENEIKIKMNKDTFLNYKYKILWLGTFFGLTSIRGYGRNNYKNFVGFMVDLKTAKGHFEIKWPLIAVVLTKALVWFEIRKLIAFM